MTDYPYLLKTGALKDLVRKIPTMGTPEKLDYARLAALGYKSSNDRPIIPVLRFIELIDSDGKPTENYIACRDKSRSGEVLAACIKKAYRDLFELYPDAQNKDKEALRNFFATNVKAGERVLGATVDTFKTLCDLADFGAAPRESKHVSEKEVGVEVPETGKLVLNVNIQLQLPATEDASIYDKIFQSLRKNLIER
jgi:hypothetical protein